MLYRAKLEEFYAQAIAAVSPERCIAHAFRFAEGKLHWTEDSPSPTEIPLPVLVLGAGKASARLARGLVHMLPPGSYRGAVVTSPGNEVEVPGITVLCGAHPTPNHQSLAAAEYLLALARTGSERASIFLLSGGASSLVAAPRPPITLADKVVTNRLLLASGAPVQAVNTVRKHISRIKGGGLLRALARDVFTVAISDVIGDDPATIGSGPTVPDPTTFAEARAVLEEYGLWSRVPPSVRTVIEQGIARAIPETLKPTDPESAFAHYRIVARNQDAKTAVALAARAQGWEAEVIGQPLQGEARLAAEAFSKILEESLAHAVAGRPRCIVAGGETTVTVGGSGLGGRNQEFALALVTKLANKPVALLSAGTDGIDGPTDAAGAFVDGSSFDRARALGLDPARYLAANDSYHFFEALHDLFRPGPTGTNVMDIVVAILYP
jgi:glycerate-2-kinase